MDPKSIADIPIAIATGIIIIGFSGFVTVNPLIMFFAWTFFITSFLFLMIANVITGGYKNDWHRNEATGEHWREGLIGIVLLWSIFAVAISMAMWDKIGSSNIQLLIVVIAACFFLSYLNVKFRYKIFNKFTPEEKENPIKIRDLKKYIRWYHWLILFTIFVILLPYILQ